MAVKELPKLGDPVKRQLSEPMKLLGRINDVVERGMTNPITGVATYARFELDGKFYYVFQDGTICRWLPRREEWKLMGGNCKGGIYQETTIKNVKVNTYVLAMTCLVKGFYEAYMADASLVVNHCVVEPMSIGTNVCHPVWGTMANPVYLEAIPQWLNFRHGAFIKRYGLYNVYVSARDLEALEKYFNEHPDRRDYRQMTTEYYTSVYKNKYGTTDGMPDITIDK